jgi:predicted RNase H-like HicB family nuclease
MIGGGRMMELIANIHLEDGSYWAVPELPGCFASGDTLDELLASLREGIQMCREEQPASDGSIPPLRIKAAVLSNAVPA